MLTNKLKIGLTNNNFEQILELVLVCCILCSEFAQCPKFDRKRSVNCSKKVQKRLGKGLENLQGLVRECLEMVQEKAQKWLDMVQKGL